MFIYEIDKKTTVTLRGPRLARVIETYSKNVKEIIENKPRVRYKNSKLQVSVSLTFDITDILADYDIFYHNSRLFFEKYEDCKPHLYRSWHNQMQINGWTDIPAECIQKVERSLAIWKKQTLKAAQEKRKKDKLNKEREITAETNEDHILEAALKILATRKIKPRKHIASSRTLDKAREKLIEMEEALKS